MSSNIIFKGHNLCLEDISHIEYSNGFECFIDTNYIIIRFKEDNTKYIEGNETDYEELEKELENYRNSQNNDEDKIEKLENDIQELKKENKNTNRSILMDRQYKNLEITNIVKDYCNNTNKELWNNIKHLWKENKKLQKENKELLEKINEVEEQVKYIPGGIEFLQAKDNFESLSK